jgi:hypothetical protein
VHSNPSFPLCRVCVIARTSFRNPAESGVGSKQLLSFVAVQRRCPSYSVASSKLARSIKSLRKVISSVCNGAAVPCANQDGWFPNSVCIARIPVSLGIVGFHPIQHLSLHSTRGVKNIQ